MRIREPMSLLCAAVIASIIGGEAAAQVANTPPNDPQASAVRSGASSGAGSADLHAGSKRKESGGTSSEEEASLATITVTALRHEESISNVPVAVSAVTADELTIQNALQVRDVAQLAPGLNITTDSPARAFISMRGIGITVLSSVQPGVGVFVDGIYEPDTGYLNSPLLDVERIEVLRGPQGTLFGSNTEGGAINVITKQPGNTWEGKASADYAGPDKYGSVSASISGPIVPDLLQVQVGAAAHRQDGFMVNQLTGQNANPLDQDAVDGTIRFLPSPVATFTLNASRDTVIGGNTPYVDSSSPSDYSTNVTENAIRRVNLTYTASNLKGEFDIQPLKTKMTVVGAFNELENQSSGDGDYGPVPYLNGQGWSNEHSYTGEVRFDTTWSANVESLLGFFAQKFITNAQSITEVIASNLYLPSSSVGQVHTGAVYGSLFWTFAEGWKLTAGARVDHENLAASTAATAAAYKDTEVDPRVSLQHRWNPALMGYVSVARGSRGGGQNGPGSPNLIYKSDYVWTYEAGTKFTAFDHRLSMNSDVFYNNYYNFIGPNALAPSTTGVGFVGVDLNAGDMKTYGFEDELDVRATSSLSFYGNLTLLHARVTSDQEYIRIVGYGLPGDRIEFIPNWNFTVGSNYDVLLQSGDNLSWNANVVAKGSRPGGSLDPTVIPMLSSYYLVNTTLTYGHNNMQFSLYADNLLNKEYLENYFDKSYLSRAGFTGDLVEDLSIPGDGRRVGVRVTVNF